METAEEAMQVLLALFATKQQGMVLQETNAGLIIVLHALVQMLIQAEVLDRDRVRSTFQEILNGLDPAHPGSRSVVAQLVERLMPPALN